MRRRTQHDSYSYSTRQAVWLDRHEMCAARASARARAAKHRGGPRVEAPRYATCGNVWRYAGEHPRLPFASAWRARGSLSYSWEAWLGVSPAHPPTIPLSLRPASSRSGQAALIHGARLPGVTGVLQAAHPPIPSQALSPPSPPFSLELTKTLTLCHSLKLKLQKKAYTEMLPFAPSLLFSVECCPIHTVLKFHRTLVVIVKFQSTLKNTKVLNFIIKY